MILLLGLLSWVQTLFLPGAVLCRLFGFSIRHGERVERVWPSRANNEGLDGRAALAMTDGVSIHEGVCVLLLSLIFNCACVMGLVALGLYTQGVMFTLMGVEVLALAALTRREVKRETPSRIEALWAWLREDFTLDKAAQFIIFLLFAYFMARGLANITTVFSAYDTVVSWNPWALSWAGGQVPPHTWSYPQVVPVLYSLPYVITGQTEIQFFSKALVGIFPIGLLGMAYSLIPMDKAYRWGTLALGLLLLNIHPAFGPSFLWMGYADFPAAFFAFGAIVCLLKAEGANKPVAFILMGAALAALSALTKQSGLAAAVAYPLLAGILLRDVKKSLMAAVVIVIPVGLWYSNTLFTPSNYQLTQEITQGGAGWWTRLLESGTGLRPYTLFWIALGSMPTPSKTWKTLIYGWAWPYLIIWAVLWGYDVRHLLVVLPLFGVQAGRVVAHHLGRWSPTFSLKMLPALTRGLQGLGLVALCSLPFVVSDAHLYRYQERRQAKIGDHHIDDMVYFMIKSKKVDGPILTNYSYLEFLPGISEYYLEGRMYDLHYFQAQLEAHRPRFLLWSYIGPCSDEVRDWIMEASAQGVLEALWDDKDYHLYRVR